MDTLPNLSNLCNVETTLFPYLITRNNAKQPGCTNHIEPQETERDDDYRINCALEGYLMYRKLDPSEYSEPIVSTSEQYGSNFSIQDSYRGTEITFEFISFGSKSTAWLVKDETFKTDEQDWVENTFEKVCFRSEELGTINYESYKQTLMTKSDWYYLDKENKNGHMFISIVDSNQRMSQLHIPNKGVFMDKKFLYIALVCGINGFGKTMVKGVANKIAARFGLDGILLAALSNSSGPYFNWGYKFVSRLDGEYIDVKPFVQTRTNSKGEEQQFLNTDFDYNEKGQLMRKDKRKAEEEPRDSRFRSFLRRLADAMMLDSLTSRCG